MQNNLELLNIQNNTVSVKADGESIFNKTCNEVSNRLIGIVSPHIEIPIKQTASPNEMQIVFQNPAEIPINTNIVVQNAGTSELNTKSNYYSIMGFGYSLWTWILILLILLTIMYFLYKWLYTSTNIVTIKKSKNITKTINSKNKNSNEELNKEISDSDTDTESNSDDSSVSE
jgi:uncharacterized membrane protein